MESSKPILFYDIASAPPVSPFAPNPWKARYALNVKRVPYRTEWVELPEVTNVRKRLNAAPCRQFASGEDFYTLPVIHDQNEGEIVGDSFDIAVYLDKKYPDSGDRLFPKGVAMTAGFNKWFEGIFQRFGMLYVHGIPFNPETAEVSKREFCRRAGVERWEELSVEGEERRRKVEELKVALGDVAKVYGYSDGLWLEGGSKPTYADCVVGGWMVMLRKTLREWEELKTWHDGLWGRIDGELEKYAQVN